MMNLNAAFAQAVESNDQPALERIESYALRPETVLAAIEKTGAR